MTWRGLACSLAVVGALATVTGVEAAALGTTYYVDDRPGSYCSYPLPHTGARPRSFDPTLGVLRGREERAAALAVARQHGAFLG